MASLKIFAALLVMLLAQAASVPQGKVEQFNDGHAYPNHRVGMEAFPEGLQDTPSVPKYERFGLNHDNSHEDKHDDKNSHDDKTPPAKKKASPMLCITAAGDLSKVKHMPKIILPLKDTKVFCRNSYTNGFSVLCDPGRIPTTSARFFVNGRPVRTEHTRPFYIAGDYHDHSDHHDEVDKWMFSGSWAEVTCTLSTGHSLSTTIKFAC